VILGLRPILVIPLKGAIVEEHLVFKMTLLLLVLRKMDIG
jgi:hypothetical protein